MNPAAGTCPGAREGGRAPVWWYAALVTPWLLCAWLLWPIWFEAVERYYGGAVLPLAGYLFFLRWENSPAASPPKGGAAWAWGVVSLAGATGVGAGGLLLGASPLWTGAGWVTMAGAMVFSVGLLGRAGGGNWVRSALLPLGFTFTALPWPAVVAVPTTVFLRHGNAAAAAELVSQLGRPAVAHGTVIETAGGWVGVEDACAGLVALQTAIMLTLFFGELRRLAWRGRLGLLLGGVAIALAINLARATWLVWQATGGTPGADRHEVAGLIELGAATLAVTLWSLSIGKTAPECVAVVARRAPDFAPGWPIAAVGALGVLLLAVAGWYRLPSAAGAKREVSWELGPATENWRTLTLEPELRRQLRVDEVDFLGWRDVTAERDWLLLHLRWNSDPALRYATGLHGPEICLPGAGAQWEADLGIRSVEVDGVRIDFRWMRFSAGGRVFHTFSCIWDTVLAQAVAPESLAAIDLVADRRARIFERRRQFGLERITVAVNRCQDEAEALARFRAMLPQLLKRR